MEPVSPILAVPSPTWGQDSVTLIQAVQRGDVTKVNDLIKTGCDVNKNEETFLGASAVHLAALMGNTETFLGASAVHVAALMGNTEVLDLLISLGAKVNAIDGGTYGTPLTYAVMKSQADCVRSLISHGAEVDDLSTEMMESLWRLAVDEAEGGRFDMND
ncbi:ANK2 [Branchiostoma lanceolatum]|uniref:ANK2 protein n=1 Tax=Branchiostoma lanceolatum TaxID=7740 RepID=A0A8K0EHL1_BRALA|nr:ANK2 [Branchiostoma lanceolatum]